MQSKAGGQPKGALAIMLDRSARTLFQGSNVPYKGVDGQKGWGFGS